MAVQTHGPIKLNWKSSEPVLVTADDEDRFFTTAKEAAAACKNHQDSKDRQAHWSQRFKTFLAYLRLWCMGHQDVVSRCFVGPCDEGLRVFVATKGPDYRYELAEELSALDTAI